MLVIPEFLHAPTEPLKGLLRKIKLYMHSNKRLNENWEMIVCTFFLPEKHDTNLVKIL